MKHKKMLLILVCFILIIWMSASYSKKADNYYVAVVTKSTQSAFWKSVLSGVTTASTEYNLKFTFRGPENEEDYVTQNMLIEEAINNGADSIVFSAIDYNKSVEAIEKAVENGIYVVIIDSDINSDKVNIRIGTDNYEAGKMAGEAAIAVNEEQLNVGIINFDVSSANGQEREKGFRDKVSEDVRTNILKTINVQSNVQSASEGTKQLISQYPEMNVIVTFNEWTSLGVGFAIREMGLSDKISVIAFDNNKICIGMLETGDIDALIVQNPFAMGYLGVESAYKLMAHESELLPKIETKTTIATKDNIYDSNMQKVLFSLDQ